MKLTKKDKHLIQNQEKINEYEKQILESVKTNPKTQNANQFENIQSPLILLNKITTENEDEQLIDNFLNLENNTQSKKIIEENLDSTKTQEMSPKKNKKNKKKELITNENEFVSKIEFNVPMQDSMNKNKVSLSKQRNCVVDILVELNDKFSVFVWSKFATIYDKETENRLKSLMTAASDFDQRPEFEYESLYMYHAAQQYCGSAMKMPPEDDHILEKLQKNLNIDKVNNWWIESGKAIYQKEAENLWTKYNSILEEKLEKFKDVEKKSKFESFKKMNVEENLLNFAKQCKSEEAKYIAGLTYLGYLTFGSGCIMTRVRNNIKLIALKEKRDIKNKHKK